MGEKLLEQTRSGYDEVAASYRRLLADTSWEAPVDLGLVAQFLAAVPRPGRILDAGCGSGRMINCLTDSPSVSDVVGLDLSAGMLAQARADRPELEVVQGAIGALPFRSEQFDGVLAWYSVIHTPPHELAAPFAEFARVLHPGGVLLLGFQSGTGRRRLARPYGHDVELHAFLHHSGYVREALVAAGFTIDVCLDRAAREHERLPQGFVLARRR